MKYQFSTSAADAARFVTRAEVEHADLGFGRSKHMGGNKHRRTLISRNMNIMADIFRDRHGITRDQFFKGLSEHSTYESKVEQGLGLEREKAI